MTRLSRLIIAYIVAVPLALILGYAVATPDKMGVAMVGLVLFVLALPIVLQSNHSLLVFFWNAPFVLAFLPGSVNLWVIFACLTLGIGVINSVMGYRKFLRAPELTKPILFLAAVIVGTARIRGGFGMHALGSESFGGKKYFYLLVAIIGYFALTSQPISPVNRPRAVKWFFLPALFNVLSNLAYTVGPAAYFLYFIIPSGAATSQAASDWGMDVVKRYGGLGPCAIGLLCFVLARWGIRGTLEWNKPWRLALLIAALAAGLFSGFRSQLAILALLLVVQFIAEGLWKTAFLPIFALIGVLCLVPALLLANKMPFAAQRAMAFLPVSIDPNVRQEAAGSTEWRFEMWHVLLPEIPRYLLVGKGYAIDPVDLYLTTQAARSGLISEYEGSMVAGDYHSGPLSTIIPLGMFGALAFLWLLAAGVKVLFCNYRYGDIRVRNANILLFSFFLAQSLMFFLVFGDLSGQLSVFLGILGFSVSLNGGVCRKLAVAKQASVSSKLAASLVAA